MKNLKPVLAIGLFVVLWSVSGAYAQTMPNPKIAASTSWTAAIARAAGGRDITIIAPLELQHPPEYEIKPSDLEAARGADFIIYAGYEKFAERLAAVSGGAKTKVLKIYTDNLPSVFKKEAKAVAEAFGTIPLYEQWEANFDRQLNSMRTKILDAYPDRRAVVHKFLAAQAEWLGFEVVGTFGPGEGSPQTLLKLVALKPAVIIDNWHNVSGKSLAESLPGSAYAELINFPGRDGSATIEGVFSYNEKRFLEASKKAGR